VVFDTAGLKTGQYAITTVTNPDEIISLDGDSTTSAADDSFVVAPSSSGSATPKDGTTEAIGAESTDRGGDQ
jgi:hypothetical protein